MRNAENLVIQELNKLNDEIFRLYYSGYHNEAVREANSLLSLAREKLGQQHPSLRIFHDNLKYIKAKPMVSWRSNRLKAPLIEKRDKINNIKRDLYFAEVSGAAIVEAKDITDTPNNKKLATAIFSLVLIAQVIMVTFYFQFKDNYLKQYQEYSPPDTPAAEESQQEKTAIIKELSDSTILKVPLVLQYPELPRGCEVTSLAMLLQYAGVDVDKMTLAREVKKDPTAYQIRNGKVYFGNPYNGFVGDMYTMKNPGLGVYYGPILELAEAYMGDRIVNLTGGSFDDIYYFLNQEIPVWIITNARYRKLTNEYFQTWQTPTGPVKITYRMHSVLITGYDENYIYFNDPLVNNQNRKVNKEDFEEAWIQMGRQAITYLPEGKALHMILP